MLWFSLIKRQYMKNKTVTIKQINSHYARVVGSDEHQLLVWDILSYDVNTRIPGKRGVQKITRSMLDRRGNKFPFGLSEFISEKLSEQGYDTEIQEIDYKFKKSLIPKISGIKFEDYQKKIINQAGKHNRGIFVAGTGSGKTVIAGGIIAKYSLPISLFVTINKSIYKQTINDFEKWFPEIEIGRVGDNECFVSHITVALYQSLSKWDLRKYNQELELIIVDEVHAASKAINKIMKQFTNVPLRFGLTATPQIEEGNKQKFFEMLGNVGSIISEVGDDDVKARVTDVEVHMINYFCINPKGSNYHESYKRDILFSKIRNKKLLNKAKELALDKGKTCLFMVKEIQHANEIAKLAKSMDLKPYIVHSEKNEKENEKIRKLLEEKKIMLVIATQKWGTGTNIQNIECVVPCSVRESYIELIQNIGRGRRRTKDKDTLIVIDSIDKIKPDKYRKFYNYFNDYSMKRFEIYKSKGWLINGKKTI